MSSPSHEETQNNNDAEFESWITEMLEVHNSSISASFSIHGVET